jgi:pilus assembly protein Flp/PilA
MTNLFNRLWKDESGQGMVEYGLILALIALAAVLLLGGVGDKIKDIFTKAQTDLDITP